MTDSDIISANRAPTTEAIQRAERDTELAALRAERKGALEQVRHVEIPVPLPSGEIETEKKERICEECLISFEASILTIGGKPMIWQRRCNPCLLRHEIQSAPKATPSPQDARQRAFEAICPPEYRESETAWFVRTLGSGRKPSRLGPLIRINGVRPWPPLATEACRLVTLEPEVAVAEILEWDFKRGGLGLIGAPGRCKTRMMFAMLKRHVLAGEDVAAIHGAKLSRGMSAAYEDGARAAETWLAGWAAKPVLFIDDVDKAKFTESTLTDFYGLLEDRKAFLRPTCFTANATGAQMEDRLRQEAARRNTEDTIGQSLVRRLRAVAECYTV